MVKILGRWIINAIALYIVASLLSGIQLDSFGSALIAVLVISLINTLVRPILLLLTLPITILTLGLFTFIINALLLMLAGNITPGFTVDSFLTAIVGSIILSIVSAILNSLVRE